MKAVWLIIFFAVLIWSGIAPKDYFTWFLEVLPAVIGLLLIALTYKKFPLTPLLYVLILLHCVVLMVGGHYTYAEVPLFDMIKPVFGFERNNYDKLGHFMQGFVPAILAREIFIRRQLINGKFWVAIISASMCLAFSACYEIIEWLVAVAIGDSAESFLGTQGYEWDTQSDMAYAGIGAVAAFLTLSWLHDRQLRRFK